MTSVPERARAVIIGGGIAGCSTAYHLAKLGWTDVVLLEQGSLSCGTTWHAAGLVGQLRAQESLTRLIRYSTQLYSGLEAETGLGTGWKNCGSLTVARTQERFTQLRRTAAIARAFGVACEVISPLEAGHRWPLMETKDLAGAVWLPGDGKANPADLTQALAKGARDRGVRIAQGVRVTAVHTRDGRVTGVSWHSKSGEHGRIDCEVVVNCAGQWARAVGALAGVTVPLHSAEHYYVVTKEMPGITRDLPVMRDPDGYVYFKEEVGGLVMGGFEPDAKPWGMDGIPDNFEFQLLPDDWDQFAILMENALIRVPALGQAEIRQFYNGPESFTPDANYLLGEAAELAGFYVGAGFNSMGIASAGGAGMALAEWIVNGAPTMDLWTVDIRRFARFHGNRRWLHDRVKEALGLHYAMPWPNRELESARPLRRSPLFAHLGAKGAAFGSKFGWERANWFSSAGVPAALGYTFGKPPWLGAAAAEHRATREAVTVFDMSSFAKILVKGRDAESVLQRLCANDVAVPPGRTVYTPMLNERGGYESDFTLTRLSDDEFLLVTGSAQATRDLDMLTRRVPRESHCVAVDVTAQHAVLAVMGPRSRELLSAVSPDDFSNDAFAFGTSRLVDIGYATCRATRITYVGELGWELYVPVEMAVAVYEALQSAGQAFGLRDGGYYAIESLRLEKGYRAWGRELTPETNPAEAGLLFAVKLGKAVPFVGADAVRRAIAGGLRRRLVSFVLADPAVMLWGGELILRDGQPVGQLTSAAFGHSLGAAVGLGYVARSDGIADDAYLFSGRYEIDVAGERVAARASIKPPWDPEGRRIRS